MSFDINYNIESLKVSNDLEDDFEQIQNYIPIYKKYFQLDDLSWNKISLNYENQVLSLNEKVSYNEYSSLMKDGTTQNCFIKFCPLFDPLKMMVGKINDESVVLPSFNDPENINFNTSNNSAFVDSFFSYLTSKMLNTHKFIHGIDCYGSFLCIKKKFRLDIKDEVEYLFDSDFFLKNKENFNISDELYEQYEPIQSSKYKRRLTIDEDNDEIISLELDELSFKIDMPMPVTIPDSKIDFNDCYKDDSDLVYLKTGDRRTSVSKHSSSSSSCSSRSSLTSDEDDYEEYETCSESDVFSDSGSCSSSEESEEPNPIYATLPKFPVNMVFLEKCKETLDQFMIREDIGRHEWSSILMQIVMILIVYQEKFYFIHNDLHNCNVMYQETDKPFLYYKFDNKHYKVPTFGKIWKIIDFGRAIYKFKGQVFFSDSFSSNGDASTQYNCEPYLDESKQIVPPNFSFDLCRLACSLIYYFDDDDENLKEIREVVESWLIDYKGRNILYKKSGNERYPEFKLYKMITRSVKDHIPKLQLSRPIFSQYSTSKKNIKKKQNILDIDSIPSYI